jgi:hypothetical protein
MRRFRGMRRSDREESFGRSCFVVRLVSWLRVCVRKIGEIYLRLPAALQRRSVWRDPKVQHAWQTYVGESVGGHLDGIDVSLGDELSSRFSTERVSSPKSPHVRNSAKSEGALAELAERKEQTTRTPTPRWGRSAKAVVLPCRASRHGLLQES